MDKIAVMRKDISKLMNRIRRWDLEDSELSSELYEALASVEEILQQIGESLEDSIEDSEDLDL